MCIAGTNRFNCLREESSRRKECRDIAQDFRMKHAWLHPLKFTLLFAQTRLESRLLEHRKVLHKDFAV